MSKFRPPPPFWGTYTSCGLQWEQMKPYQGDYLESRCINDETVSEWLVKQDQAGNACFPHFEVGGICGWEVANRGDTPDTTRKSFSAEGCRGLGLMMPSTGDPKRLVICESSIDCMSHHQLFHVPGDVYVSLSGALTPLQGELLMKACHAFSVSNLAIAVDSDQKGCRISEDLQTLFGCGFEIQYEAASEAKDWNEFLQRSTRADHNNRSTNPRP